MLDRYFTIKRFKILASLSFSNSPSTKPTFSVFYLPIYPKHGMVCGFGGLLCLFYSGAVKRLSLTADFITSLICVINTSAFQDAS